MITIIIIIINIFEQIKSKNELNLSVSVLITINRWRRDLKLSEVRGNR